MPNIRKVVYQPIELEALEYDGSEESAREITSWVMSCEDSWDFTGDMAQETNGLRLVTKTCDITLTPTDWVVRHSNGRFRKYRRDEFFSTFEDPF